MGKLASTFSPGITSMIQMDHAHVMTTFHQYKMSSGPKAKQAVVNAACLALEIHAQLEEEIFYPAMRSTPVDNALVKKSVPEHEEMRRLIADLRAMEPTDSDYDQLFMELIRDVMHHVADEETTLLPDAERMLSAEQLNALGAQMTRRRLQLVAPRSAELAGNMISVAARNKVVVAGALLAGSYFVTRALTARHPSASASGNKL